MSKTYKNKPKPKEPDDALAEKLYRKRKQDEKERALADELKEQDDGLDTGL